jgi:hypothetical protein
MGISGKAGFACCVWEIRRRAQVFARKRVFSGSGPRDTAYGYYNQGSFGIGNQPIPGQFQDVSMWQPPKGQNVEVLRQLK